jgi:sporulation protein YlmC with PRC-barrel domain
MLTEDQARETIGRNVVSDDGETLGKVGQLVLDDETGEPAFVTVNTGMFGTNETFVPVGAATLSGDDVAVPFGKQKVKDVPNVDIT